MRLQVRRHLAVFIGAMLVLGSIARAAEDKSPTIREFDIATIERLGREIHEQDQWAWKAADAMFAKRSESQRNADGVRGWITDRVDGKPRVRFVGGQGDVPEALYDVVFESDGTPLFSIPTERTLKPEEVAQHAARGLALAGAGNKCSRSYNTVALKDPAGDGWLVWALAATTDADAIIIGGHFRFTVSGDGKSVRARDELSKGCLRFSRKQMGAQGAPVEALMTSHLVSLTPVETHVFSNLSYQLKIVVGTMDGRAWKIDGGRVALIDMDMPGFDGFAARVTAGFAERCAIIASTTNEEPKKYVTADAPSMILATESDRPFKIEMPSGYKAESVMCGRLEIVPAPNDYKVVLAGYPLYILDIGVGHPQRTGVVELSEGRFRFRMTEGPALSDELSARVGKRLDGFQNAAQAKTVSLMSPQVAHRGAIALGSRFGRADEAMTGTQIDIRRGKPTERQGYVTGSVVAGFGVQMEEFSARPQ